MTKITAVVLNHRSAPDTARCIQHLRRLDHPPLDVIVVDNGSGPEEEALLRSRFPTVIATGSNLGYAGGNNAGIAAALDRGAEAVWLLNPDTEVDPDSLRLLSARLRRPTKLGIVGLTLVDGSTGRIESRGGRLDWASGGRSELVDSGRPAERVRPALRPVDFVPGAAILIRREVFEDIGLLPEHYFMYFEETQFCVEAARAGWVVGVEQAAVAMHHGGSRKGPPVESFIYYFVRNRLLFGQANTDVDVAVMERDLERWIEGWRGRIVDEAPERLERFEQILELALADGRALVDGRREGIATT